MTASPVMPPRWQIARKIPLMLVLAILIQSASALVWAGQAAQRIAHLEDSMRGSAERDVRIARIEEQIVFMRASLARIEHKLDQAALAPRRTARLP